MDGEPRGCRAARAAGRAPKKSKTWLWVLLSIVGVIVLFFGGCSVLIANIASNSDNPTTAGSSGSTGGSSGAESVGATLGDEVRDGKFAFVVDSVAPSDSPLGMTKPRGEWVIVILTVANIGNEPQSFFVQNQKLIDSQGRQYVADTMAAMSLNPDDAMIVDMNPGFSAKVHVPFDVPPGTDPAVVELHDSAFSGGVTVHI